MRSRNVWRGVDYEPVFRLVRERTGLVFSGGIRSGAEAAIRRAMARSVFDDLSRYLGHLSTDSVAFDELVAELTVGETYFFREPAQLDFIRREVLQPMLKKHSGMRGLRVWSAGCASGEEAYTLAILLHELDREGAHDILGTDVSRERLARARLASYSRWSLRGVDAGVTKRYFQQRANRFALREDIRSAVSFRHLNLAEDVYPSVASGVWENDLILCRNVLIYLDPETVARVAQRLMDSLSDEGWLFLGASDPPLMDLVPCEVVVTGAGIAYRKPGRSVQPFTPQGSEAQPWGPVPVRIEAPPARTAPLADRTPPSRPAPRAPVPRVRTPVEAEEPDAKAPFSRYAERDYAGAAELAAQRLEKEFQDIALWVLLVRALANQGRLVEADRACTAALEKHGTSAVLMYLHAVLLSESGHHTEAVVAARRALYLDRGLIVAHLVLGGALLRLGETEGARRAFQNAERLLSRLRPDEPVREADGELAGNLLDLARAQRRMLTEAA